MGELLFWILVGVVAGWLAKTVVPGEAPRGVVSDFVVGIVGAVTGGFLLNGFMGRGYGGWLGTTAVAFVGAVVFLSIVRLVNVGGLEKK